MTIHYWLDEAEKKLAIAKRLADHEYFEEACCFAQQAAEIALKGYAKHKDLKLIGHSIVSHIHKLDTHAFIEKDTRQLLEYGAYLDEMQVHHYPHI